MRVSIIAAVGRNFVIGTDEGLPWRLPNDLRRFRRLTLGKPVILGRRTFELLKAPLPDRPNIILTRDPGYSARDCPVVHSLEAALLTARTLLDRLGGEEVMVAGGGEVYAQSLACADRLYLTVVDGVFEGSAHFPRQLPEGTGWKVEQVEHSPADGRNPFAHDFYVITRVSPGDPGAGSLSPGGPCLHTILNNPFPPRGEGRTCLSP